MPEEQTTIGKELYDQLLEEREFLIGLLPVGVVHWEGYDVAVYVKMNGTGSLLHD